MSKIRLDQYLVDIGLVRSRSQALSYIKLGHVKADDKVVKKPSYMVSELSSVELSHDIQYVSRAALKLESANRFFKINFKDKVVLDVGSSTGGFSDFAIKNGAKKIIAVDVGTNQLDRSLHGNSIIELHEKTDIRDFKTEQKLDIILIDVSFISFKNIAEAIYKLSQKDTLICLMAKPQFETSKNNLTDSGVVKNNQLRRLIFKYLEEFMKTHFKIIAKIDSGVPGKKGNLEKFYLMKKI